MQTPHDCLPELRSETENSRLWDRPANQPLLLFLLFFLLLFVQSGNLSRGYNHNIKLLNCGQLNHHLIYYCDESYLKWGLFFLIIQRAAGMDANRCQVIQSDALRKQTVCPPSPNTIHLPAPYKYTTIRCHGAHYVLRSHTLVWSKR